MGANDKQWIKQQLAKQDKLASVAQMGGAATLTVNHPVLDASALKSLLNRLAHLFNQEMLSEAKQLALELTSKFPKQGQAWKVLGAIYLQQGALLDAEQALSEAVKRLPKDAEAHYNLANVYFDQEKLTLALSSYERAVKLAPQFLQAHFNLGSVCQALGQFAEAEKSYKKALQLSPNHLRILGHLAVVLHQRKQYKEAIRYVKQAIQLSAKDDALHLQLGLSQQALGQVKEAIASYQQAVAIAPEHAANWVHLGVMFHQQGDTQGAEQAYQQAIHLDSNHVAALKNLGLLHQAAGRAAEAESCYRQALTVAKPTAETLNNMAAVLMNQGRHAEAEQFITRALDLAPQHADVLNNYGLLLQTKVSLPASADVFEQALKVQPQSAQILINYSVTLRLQGRLREAEDVLKKALEINPKLIDAYINLGNIYMDQGMIALSLTTIDQALWLDPTHVVALSNRLFTSSYIEKRPSETLAYAQAFSAEISKKVPQPFQDWYVTEQDQRLRIGLVSGDLRQHSVAYFLKNVLQHWDASQVDLVAYSTDGREDAMTATLKPYFTAWRSLAGHHDQAAAEIIRQDGVHVLIDLSGHTAGNKLPLFAWKPAPVQVSWLGYWATTGLPEMDYVLADAVSLPREQQAAWVEQVQYLPHTRMCFSPPEMDLAVSVLPALSNGCITFGSYQNLAKVGEAVLQLWAQVLHAVPNAVLRWQCKAFNDVEVITTVKQQLSDLGVTNNRVKLLGRVAREHYLASYAEVDILLDTHPFTGGTTTCEALWMGVPTLTLAGHSLIARQGASLMTAAGLGEWVADTPAQYLEKAVHFAQNIGTLAALRAGMRAQVIASPLFDGALFVQHFIGAVNEMWQSKKGRVKTVSTYTKEHQLAQVVSNEQAVRGAGSLTVKLVSATRMTEESFWETSALGTSLKPLLATESRLAFEVAFENTLGLSTIFNQAIANADDDTVLVFMHDDVWIDQADFVDAILLGLQQYDVIGVAGNRRRVPKQPAWPFINTDFVWDDDQYLSGSVGHGKYAHGKISHYGKVPAACELMDGVFLATKKTTLTHYQVAFDPQFDFHFYDLDFCRSARAAGMTLGTWPIQLTHQSGGAFGSPSWQVHYQGYLKKWREHDLPDSDIAEVMDIHTFGLVTVEETAATFNAKQLYPAVEYTTQAIPIFGKPSPNPLVKTSHVLKHPAIYVAEVTDFKVIGSAAFPIVQDKCIKPQYFTTETWETAEQGLGYCSVRTDINLVGYARLGEHVEHDCKVISLIGNGAINYAHWLTEFLPQIVVLKNAGVDLSQYRILVHANAYPSMLESLYLLGVKPDQLMMVASFSLHHFPQAMWLSPIANVVFQRPKASHGVGKDITSAPDRAIYHPEALFALREAMLEKVSLETRAQQPERIFIRRNPSNAINARMLVNEQAIEELLVANGFVGIDPSALSFIEQVTVFSNAQYIVAASGAAILNMLWAPANAHVLVMMNDTRYANYWYFGNVATPIGQTLTYILGETLDAQLGGDIVHSNFTIDPQAVLDALQHRGLTDLVNPQQSLHNALQEVLDLAIEQQNAGELAIAEQLYHEVLNVQPNHAEANHHLAVIETHTERLTQAISRFELAVTQNKANEQYWVSYVDALMLAGHVDKAVKTLEIGQQFGLSAETAQQLAAEFVAQLEAQPPQDNVTSSGQIKPILATLVPAYKHTFIPQLLVSLATQSYPTGQIIISDDSPNGEVSKVITDPALAHIVKKLDITIIQGPKQGTMSNVVHLLEHWQMSSQLVHILFDDDILYPTFYAEHVKAHTQEAIGASVSYRWFTNELGQPFMATPVPAFLQQSTHQIDFIGADELFASVVPTCDNWLGEFSNTVFSADAVQLYKRSRMEDIAYYGLGDVGLLLEISLYAKVAIIKNYLGGFRQNAQQNTVNYDSPVFKCGTVAWVALALASYKLGKINAQQLQQTVQLIQGAVNARFQQSADMQGFIKLFSTHAPDSAAFEQAFLPLWQQLLACKDWLHAQQIGQFA